MKPKIFLALLLLVAMGCHKKENSLTSLITKQGRLIKSPTASTECGGRTHILKSPKGDLDLIFVENIIFSQFENKEVIIKGNFTPKFKDCPILFKVEQIVKK
ncbi:MAG: hypothetical protein Q4A09_07975 [Capnocytophaga felis]|nr:hypothetical protein [Capnocytophaga felis]